MRAPRLNGRCGVEDFFRCDALWRGAILLAIASLATLHFPSCKPCSRHTLRLAFSLTPHGDGDWFGPDDRAAHGVEKLFQKSLKVLLTGSRHRPILPPHTTDIRPRAKTQQAWKPTQFCPSAKRQLFLLFAYGRPTGSRSVTIIHTRNT